MLDSVEAAGAVPPRTAWITAVYSGKGGVGRTTVALNLACALAARGSSVVAVDLDLQYGDMAAAIDNLNPHTTIADLATVPDEHIDMALVRAALTRGPAGISLLAAPALPELADVAENHRAAVEMVVQLLASAYDHVVLDMGRQMSETGAALVEICDRLVLVTTPLSIALKNLRRAQQLLERLGFPKERVLMVLNRVDEHSNFTPAEVEANLGQRLAAVLPHDSRVAVGALDEGQPVVLSRPRSQLAVALQRLAAEIDTDAKIALVAQPG